MSRLAIGSVQFGLPYGISNTYGQTSSANVAEILNLAGSRNIDLIDTAIDYGNSERVLGDVGIKNFKIVTKLGNPPASCKDYAIWVRGQVEGCLTRLGVKRLYAVLFHSSKCLIGGQGSKLFGELQNLKALGFIEKVGISIYSPTELDLLEGKIDFDLVQAPLNILDRRLETSGWLDKLNSNNVEVHTRSSFLQGLLLMDRCSFPLAAAEHKVTFDRWKNFLEYNNFDAISSCLSYPLSLSGVHRVIVGINDAVQLNQLIEAEKRSKDREIPDFYSSDETLIDPRFWDLA